MTFLLAFLLVQPVPEDSIWALFDRVAHPYLKYQDLKEPSKEALIGMGGDAAEVLVERLRTRNAREYHALEEILKEIGTAAIPPLISALDDSCERLVRLSIRILGKIGDPGPIPEILEFLDDTLWKNRASAVEALGAIGEASTLSEIIERAPDTVDLVRKEVAHALSRFDVESARATLLRMLGDPFSSVRFTAYTSLRALEAPLPEILRALRTSSGFERALCLRLLELHRDHPLSKATLMDELHDGDWRIRTEAARALKGFTISFSDRQKIEFLRVNEEHPLAALTLKYLQETP
jgi:HEAT repeat protein